MGGRFVFMMGPSCVGKGPLRKAIKRFDLKLDKQIQQVVLYTSRPMRKKEVQDKTYHFRKANEIKKLSSDPNFIVFKVRKDWQAVDLKEVKEIASRPDGLGLLEVFHTAAKQLKAHPLLSSCTIKTVFISPLSKYEIEEIKAMDGLSGLKRTVFELMRNKLTIRTYLNKGKVLPKDEKDIKRRASTAFKEMQSAVDCDYVIPLSDGEGSPNWGSRNTIFGSAKSATINFLKVLNGKIPLPYEKWDSSLFK